MAVNSDLLGLKRANLYFIQKQFAEPTFFLHVCPGASHSPLSDLHPKRKSRIIASAAGTMWSQNITAKEGRDADPDVFIARNGCCLLLIFFRRQFRACG